MWKWETWDAENSQCDEWNAVLCCCPHVINYSALHTTMFSIDIFSSDEFLLSRKCFCYILNLDSCLLQSNNRYLIWHGFCISNILIIGSILFLELWFWILSNICTYMVISALKTSAADFHAHFFSFKDISLLLFLISFSCLCEKSTSYDDTCFTRSLFLSAKMWCIARDYL